MVTLIKEQNDKITAKSFDELISKLEKHGYDCKNCYEGDDYLRLKKDGDTYQAKYYKKDNGSYELYLGNIHPSKKTKKESLVRENNAYPNDWRPSRDSAFRVFNALDQSQSKNPGWLEDNYGLSIYDVKWSSPSQNAIDIYAAMDDGDYRYDETFYIYPNTEKDTYIIDTMELGERTVGKLTDVLDIISTCLRKQMKDSYSESLTTEKLEVPKDWSEGSKKVVNEIEKKCQEFFGDEWDKFTDKQKHDFIMNLAKNILKLAEQDEVKESLITEKNWSLTIPSSLSKAFREELDAVDDWDDEETQTEHIQKAMGALINICKFINNRLPDADFFEDAESEINNLLDNIYNYEEYDMDFDEAKEEIDYFLNDFWEECDANNIFVQV